MASNRLVLCAGRMKSKHRKRLIGLALPLAMLAFAPAARAAELADGAVKSDVSRASDLVARAAQLLDEAEAAKSSEKKVVAYEQARDTARQVLALDENNADAHFVVFAAEGRLELLSGAVPNPVRLYKAQDRLDHVLELDPSHPDGLAAKGGLYRQLPWALGGNLDKAETFLKRAIEENPEAIGARLELAATYLDKGEPEKCGRLIDEAVAIAEKQGKTHRVEEAVKLRAELASR
jgi:tetratricopeptide (TPR) repeat protein